MKLKKKENAYINKVKFLNYFLIEILKIFKNAKRWNSSKFLLFNKRKMLSFEIKRLIKIRFRNKKKIIVQIIIVKNKRGKEIFIIKNLKKFP